MPQVGPCGGSAGRTARAALAAGVAGVVVAADEGDDTVPGAAQAATMRVANAATTRRAAGTEAITPPCDRFLAMNAPPPVCLPEDWVKAFAGSSCTALLRGRRGPTDHELGRQERNWRLVGSLVDLGQQDLRAAAP